MRVLARDSVAPSADHSAGVKLPIAAAAALLCFGWPDPAAAQFTEVLTTPFTDATTLLQTVVIVLVVVGGLVYAGIQVMGRNFGGGATTAFCTVCAAFLVGFADTILSVAGIGG